MGTSAVEWRVITVIEMCSVKGTLAVRGGLSHELISLLQCTTDRPARVGMLM